jgi:hypothetical protein
MATLSTANNYIKAYVKELVNIAIEDKVSTKLLGIILVLQRYITRTCLKNEERRLILRCIDLIVDHASKRR